MAKRYRASITDVMRKTWVEDEQYGEVVLTNDFGKRMIFYSEDDAWQVWNILEESSSPGFVIVTE